MHMVDLILKKRGGAALSKDEIDAFIRGVTDGEIPDYQTAALLMAICFVGMTPEETAWLTVAMASSGKRADLSSIPGRKVDKHSTGGVGDTTTLVLVPLVAACGAKVAKMSGRGLGHTGGTLDKLSAIPGMRTDFGETDLVRLTLGTGAAIIGQTSGLAPADKLLYALRDVTGTVESIPLIASSIMSKKIAAGADALVLDVKTGTGAFMEKPEDAVALAEAMVSIGELSGIRTTALVTDMNQPLGMYIGNALEVEEAIMVLRGETGGPLLDVSLELGARMLIAAGITESVSDGREKLLRALKSGAGLAKLKEIISAQGGDPEVCDDTSKLPKADVIHNIISKEAGFLTSMRAAEIGRAACRLGAGRETAGADIDLGVGIVMKKRVGDMVSKGEILAVVHARNESDAIECEKSVLSALNIETEYKAPPPLVYRQVELRIAGGGGEKN